MFDTLKERLRRAEVKDFFNLFGGNVFAQLLNLLAFLLVARHLGAESYGRFAVWWAIFTVLGMINELGLSQAFVKEGSEWRHDPNRFKKILATALQLRLVLSLAVAAIVYLSFPLWGDRFAPPAPQIRLFLLATPLYALFLFYLAYRQARLSFQTYARHNVLMYFIRLIGTLVFVVLLNGDTAAALFTFALAYAVALPLLWPIVRSLRFFKKQTDGRLVRRLLTLGGGIFLIELLHTLLYRIDLLMLQRLDGPLSAGWYAAALQVALIFPLVTNTLFTTLFPRTGEMIRRHGIGGYTRSLLRLSPYVGALLLAAEVAGFLGFPLLFGPDFQAAVPLLGALLAIFALEVLVKPVTSVYFFRSHTGTLALILALQLLLNFLLNLWWIPQLHAYGALAATFVSRVLGASAILWRIGRMEHTR